jgi:hypothetical protein
MASQEKYSRDSYVRKIRLGLISALTAVNLKEECGTAFSEYNEPGKKTLEEISNPHSDIYSIYPDLFKKNESTIENALRYYPKPESREYLLALLASFS